MEHRLKHQHTSGQTTSCHHSLEARVQWEQVAPHYRAGEGSRAVDHGRCQIALTIFTIRGLISFITWLRRECDNNNLISVRTFLHTSMKKSTFVNFKKISNKYYIEKDTHHHHLSDQNMSADLSTSNLHLPQELEESCKLVFCSALLEAMPND